MRRTDSSILHLVAPACAVLNIAIGSVLYITRAPIYLDNTGTILLALLLGRAGLKPFLYCAFVGAVSYLLGGAIYKPVLPWFSGTAIAVAACAVFILVPLYNRYARFGRTALAAVVLGSGVLTGLVAALVSLPVAVFIFGGVTGSGSTLLVAAMQAMGAKLLEASFWSSVLIEPVDKTLQIIVSLTLLNATPAVLRDRLARG